MIPGANLLNMALTVIAPQSAQYYADLSRATNAIGLDNTTYAAPVTVRASIQPVSRELVEQYGLDLQRTYITVYISQAVVDIDRDVSGDQIVFNGSKYNMLSDTKWQPLDGWTACICVKVP